MGTVFGSVLSALQDALLDPEASRALREALAEGLVVWGPVALAPTLLRLQQALGTAPRPAALAWAALVDRGADLPGATGALCGLQRCTAQCIEALRGVGDQHELWALVQLTRHDRMAGLLRAMRPHLAPRAVSWKERSSGVGCLARAFFIRSGQRPYDFH